MFTAEQDMLRALVRAALQDGVWQPLADWLKARDDPRGRYLAWCGERLTPIGISRNMPRWTEHQACPSCGESVWMQEMSDPYRCYCGRDTPQADLLPPLPS